MITLHTEYDLELTICRWWPLHPCRGWSQVHVAVSAWSNAQFECWQLHSQLWPAGLARRDSRFAVLFTRIYYRCCSVCMGIHRSLLFCLKQCGGAGMWLIWSSIWFSMLLMQCHLPNSRLHTCLAFNQVSVKSGEQWYQIHRLQFVLIFTLIFFSFTSTSIVPIKNEQIST